MTREEILIKHLTITIRTPDYTDLIALDRRVFRLVQPDQYVSAPRAWRVHQPRRGRPNYKYTLLPKEFTRLLYAMVWAP